MEYATEVLEPLDQSIEALLSEGLRDVSLQALWNGERPKETNHVSARELVAVARNGRLRTKTKYVVDGMVSFDVLR